MGYEEHISVGVIVGAIVTLIAVIVLAYFGFLVLVKFSSFLAYAFVFVLIIAVVLALLMMLIREYNEGT